MGDFFAELRRRHIYRIGAGYVIAAWAVVQVLDVLSQLWALPDWIAQPITIVLAIGLPVTLIAAWMIEGKAHEAVASAVRSKATTVDWLLFGALALVLLGIGYQQFASAPQQISGVEAAREAAASPDTAVSLAVLPFANLSGDPAQESFSDGITDEISSALAKIPDLRVVARRSAYEFKNQNTNMATIANALGATHLIDGSVRMAADRVRITAQLVHAEDGLQIWSEDFDRELIDIFAVQEEVAQAIAASLGMQVGLSPDATLIESRTDDLAAYQDFLRARSLIQARSVDEAILLLESVTERDPNFAPAWALLSVANTLAMWRDGDIINAPVDQARAKFLIYKERSETAAFEAVRLSPNDPMSIAAEANVEHRFLGRRQIAEDLYREALNLDPYNPQILDLLSQMLSYAGRTDDSLELRQQLNTVEPFVPVYKIRTAKIMLEDGLADEAIGILEATETEDNNYNATRHETLAIAYAELGRFDTAANVLLAATSNLLPRSQLEELADLLRTMPNVSAEAVSAPQLLGNTWLAGVYPLLGMPENMMNAYERHLQVQGFTEFYGWHRSFAQARQTERFKNLVRQGRLLDYWLERGFADLCRPIGENDFECD